MKILTVMAIFSLFFQCPLCILSAFSKPFTWSEASLVAQTVKNMPAMQKNWV